MCNSKSETKLYQGQTRFILLLITGSKKLKVLHLSQVQDRRAEVLSPAVLALGADVPGVPVAVHDGLEDGGEGGDPDAGADEDCVLGPENLARGGSEGPVDVDLKVDKVYVSCSDSQDCIGLGSNSRS